MYVGYGGTTYDTVVVSTVLGGASTSGPDGRLPSVVRCFLTENHEQPRDTAQFLDNGQRPYSVPNQQVNVYSNELQLL